MIRELIDIVTEIPEIASESGRLNFLRILLDGLPRINQILWGMNLGGAPRQAASEIVLKLRAAGSYAPEKSYLLDFINGLIGVVTDYQQGEALKGIAQGMTEGGTSRAPVVTALDTSDWRGKDTAGDYASFKERVIGEDTLRPFYYVRLAVEAGAAVCRISSPAGLGTGFLIAPNLLMTNNHVLPLQGGLAQTELWFRYEQNPNGTDAPVIVVRPMPGGLFHTEKAHDVSVIELEPAGAALLQNAGVKPLTLARTPAKEGDRVAIIQHAGGLQKKISFQNNKVQYADASIVDYTTTTLPGSSGSPVLNDLFEVVGLHREGGSLRVPDSDRIYYRNRGTSVSVLFQWLAEKGIMLT